MGAESSQLSENSSLSEIDAAIREYHRMENEAVARGKLEKAEVFKRREQRLQEIRRQVEENEARGIRPAQNYRYQHWQGGVPSTTALSNPGGSGAGDPENNPYVSSDSDSSDEGAGAIPGARRPVIRPPDFPSIIRGPGLAPRPKGVKTRRGTAMPTVVQGEDIPDVKHERDDLGTAAEPDIEIAERITTEAKAAEDNKIKDKENDRGIPDLESEGSLRYAIEEEDDEEEPTAVDRIALDWLQGGKHLERARDTRILFAQEVRIQSPPWIWNKKYLVLYADLGLWMFNSKDEVDQPDKGRHFMQPNGKLEIDSMYESKLILSKKEEETEFVVKGVHTHYAVNRLARWRIEAGSQREKSDWLTELRKVSRHIRRQERARFDRENIQGSQRDKEATKHENIPSYELMLCLVHNQLNDSVQNSMFVFYGEFMKREALFKWLLDALESAICHVNAPMKNETETAVNLLRHLAKVWNLWVTHRPEDMFEPREWQPPGDFAKPILEERPNRRRDNYNVNNGIGERLLLFLQNLHLCNTKKKFGKVVASGDKKELASFIIDPNPAWVKRLDERFFETIRSVVMKVKKLKKALSKPPKPFITIGPWDPFDVRDRKHVSQLDSLNVSFEDLHRKDGKRMIRFFQRTDPYFMSDTKYADGILAFKSDRIAEQMMIHDMKLFDNIPLASMTNVTSEEGKKDNITCRHLKRAQEVFAKRVQWIAFEILRKNVADTDESAHLESVMKVMQKFMSIAERSMQAENHKFTNHFAIFAIVHAFSLDYIDIHTHKLEEKQRERLLRLKRLKYTEEEKCPRHWYVPRICSMLTTLKDIRERHPPAKRKRRCNMNLLHESWPVLNRMHEIKVRNRESHIGKLDKGRFDADGNLNESERFDLTNSIPSVQVFLYCALHSFPIEEDLIELSQLISSAELLPTEEKQKEDDQAQAQRLKGVCYEALSKMCLNSTPVALACLAAIFYTIILVIAFSGREEYSVQYVRAFIVGCINFLSIFNFLYIYWFECRGFFSEAHFKVTEFSVFADKNWFVWTISLASLTGAAHFISDSFNGADVSVISDEINFYLMLVIANMIQFFVGFLVMPYFIDVRERSWFWYNTSFCIFVAFCVKVSISLGYNGGSTGIILAIFATILSMWKDRKTAKGNNPDYLQFFALAINALPTGIGRPLFLLQSRIGDDQWNQVIFFACWTGAMEIVRIVLLIAFRKGIHEHEDSWVILFPLRMLDVMGTVMVFLFIRPHYGFLVCIGIMIFKDIIRNTGIIYERQFWCTHKRARSHEWAVFLITWYNLCVQTVTSEIMAVIMMVAVLSTEVVIGDWIGYAVTNNFSQQDRYERLVQYCIVLAAAFIAGQISIFYSELKLKEAKKRLWLANRAVHRDGVNLLMYPSLLNRKQSSSSDQYKRHLSLKYTIFYVSESTAIFGTLLYSIVLIDRLKRSGLLD
ncbi:hypothetical protein AAMO2058_001635700 [Amorphochlora amoebiformis]